MALLAMVVATDTLGATEHEKTRGASSTIQVTYVGDITGILGYLGTQVQDGLNLALNQINSSRMLGNRKIVMTSMDTTSNAATATTLMAQAIASKSSAVFGPLLSSETGTLAAEAQQAGVVYYVFGESPTAVNAGQYVYRLETPQTHYIQLLYDQLAKQKIKSANIIYSSDQSALAALAYTARAQLGKVGIKLGAKIGVPTATTDWASEATKLEAGHPGAIGVYTAGGSVNSVIAALRNSGYAGQIFANDAATNGALKPSGSASYGVLFPTAYHPQLPFKTSKQFTKLWEKTHPTITPTSYGAFGYDTMMGFANAVKASGSASRDGVLKGMQMLARKGTFDGAQGTVTFVRPTLRDVTCAGDLVRWTPNGEQLVAVGKPGLVIQPLKK